MTKNFNTPNTMRYTPSDEWLTPPWMIQKLVEARGKPFDVDPCAAVKQPWRTATEQWTKTEDGLSVPWSPDMDYWVNPPYGKSAAEWMSRLAEQGNGMSVLFARTDTTMYQDIIFPSVSGFLFVEGRVKFWEQTCAHCTEPASQHKDNGSGCADYEPSGHAIESAGGNAPSIILAFGKRNAEILKRCGIPGTYAETVERI